MSKQRNWFAVLTGVVAIGGLTAWLAREREPSYQGKSLSQWMILYSRFSEEPEINDAIYAIGSNAVPYMVEWIQYRESNAKSRTMDLINLVREKLFRTRPMIDQEESRATGAMLAFQILSNRALSAIGPLSSLATGSRVTSTNDAQRLAAARATIALQWLGEPALPPLMNALTNRQNLIPQVAAEAIGNMGSTALPAIPALVESAQSTNSRLASKAMVSLGKLQLQPEVVVPALINQLSHPDAFRRRTAADSLGRLGPAAVGAEPTLRSMLTETNERVRKAVSTALRQISVQSNTNVPIR